MEKILLTVTDVAKALQLSTKSAYKLMHRPDFPLIKIGSKMYVKEGDLNEYLDDYVRGQIYL
jgi:excisionase family DNA binding protein